MIRRTHIAICIAVAFGFRLFPEDDLLARGRSFPIEIAGIVTSYDRVNHTFTFRADGPDRNLTIAVGRGCKFKQTAASTEEQMLRPGARLKVSYFATIFTGDVAVEIESHPLPEVRTSAIKKSRPPKIN